MPYHATKGEGPRFPVVNRRVTPTEAGQYVILNDVIPVQEFPDNSDIGYCRLRERPVSAYGGAGIVVKDNNTSEMYSGTTAWPPNASEFFISPYLGRVYFHSSAIGRHMSFTYSGMGSIIDATDVNHVYDMAKQAAAPVEKVELAAGASVIVDKIAVAVLGMEFGAYVLNPSYVGIRYFDIFDPETARTEITNNSADAQTLGVKFHMHFDDGEE